MVERGLERVVVGVGDGALQLHAAERGAEGGARGLLVERPARRAQAQAQRGIGGVGLLKHQ